MGLGDPDKGRRSYDLEQYARPWDMQTLSMLLIGAHFAKWDLISLMAAALDIVSEDAEQQKARGALSGGAIG
jgi:hypothetical protein